MKAAMCAHLLARCHSFKSEFKQAIDYEKEVQKIYSKQFGKEHDKTRGQRKINLTNSMYLYCLSRIRRVPQILDKTSRLRCKDNECYGVENKCTRQFATTNATAGTGNHWLGVLLIDLHVAPLIGRPISVIQLVVTHHGPMVKGKMNENKRETHVAHGQHTWSALSSRIKSMIPTKSNTRPSSSRWTWPMASISPVCLFSCT